MRARLMGVAVVFVLASLAHAGPDTITYQGSLLNQLGGSVTNGTYQMQLKIFDAASGGTKRWEETDNVQVTRGLFATTLGDGTPFDGLFLTYPDLWLEVTVDVDRSGTFEGDEVFSPRQNLAGVPWACPRLEPNSICPNMIGGHASNATSPGAVGATIAGGSHNVAGDQWATIGGGDNNRAIGYSSVIGGGEDNVASGTRSTVGGGLKNEAHGSPSTVSGGSGNVASGHYATIPGGQSNVAAGYDSFAAGRRAKATHQGSFVWGDSTDANFDSLRDNQFRIRANGGAGFNVNDGYWVDIWVTGAQLIRSSTGAFLSTAGKWTDGCDRNMKESFAPVDGQEALARLARLPVTTWSHKAEGPSIRHMGPVAQDFYAAFGLGQDDRHIAALDANGVALAAIQGLYQIVQEKDAEIADLKAQLTAQQQQDAAMQVRLATLETLVERMAGQLFENGQ